jgi:hypothetical protein
VSAAALPAAEVGGGALLTWNVTAANGAADVSLTIVYGPRS